MYEIDEVEGKTFISMSLIEGVSLDQKIAEGPLKLDEALSIGQQIAKGLDAAHKRGIIHRDIKPENIMVGEDGHVTIMDFGLAQLTEASRLTKTDETVGTVAYMSPEQTDGSGTDHRTDIWSLGVVLYEMVTGRQPFKGDYDKAVMYSILNEEPVPITALRTGVPIELEVLAKKCLAKEQGARYQRIDELAVDLRSLITAASVPAVSRVASPVSRSGSMRAKRRRGVWLAAVGALVAVLAAVVWSAAEGESPEAPLRNFFFPTEVADNAAVISPNGKHIVYRTGPFQRRTVWTRDIDSEFPRQIATPERNNYFFWSPDSRFVAFRSGEYLVKAPVGGGLLQRVCEQPGGFGGGSWSPDGASIVFAAGTPSRLYRVPAQGGTPALLDVSKDDAAVQYIHPHFLPAEAGRNCLVYSKGGSGQPEVVVADLDRGAERTVAVGYFPFYSPSGHILFQTTPRRFTSDLWAVPFSISDRGPVESFPIRIGASGASVANDGTLLFRSTRVPTERKLQWLDRSGQEISSLATVEQSLFAGIALSHDESKVAVVTSDSSGESWIYDLALGGRRPFLTPSWPLGYYLLWSPDGRQISYGQGGRGIFTKETEDIEAIERSLLMTSDRSASHPASWSRDGRYLIYGSLTVLRGGDIRYLSRSDSGSDWAAHDFLATQFNEANPALSPDGRWLAYASDESGVFEVYVRPFPQGGAPLLVSPSGGSAPQWSPDGDELFYLSEGALFAAQIQPDGELAIGNHKRLFALASDGDQNDRNYAVADHGERILVLRSTGDPPKPAIHVVQNWYEEFRDRE